MNKYYLEKADINSPKLYETEVVSDTVVDILPDDSAFFGVSAVNARKNKEVFGTGETFTLDFGDHCVGYLSFRMRHNDRYLDAPVRLKLRFGETAYELSRDFSTYHGGLCPSWLQEDIINIDFPETVQLPRRYCFRYL
ncbi:MAG: sugar hydrolase, partial [Clostridia bacterium]|nr:sugar hydrolase [Clostridia bacterium]